jgi:hypothetical protein
MKKIDSIFAMCADSPEKFRAMDLERFFDSCLSENIRLSTARKYVESLPNLNPYTKQSIERIYNLFLEDEQQPEEIVNVFEDTQEPIIIENKNSITLNECTSQGSKLAHDLTVIPVNGQYRVVGDKIDARVKESYMIYDVTGKGARKYKIDIIEAVSMYINKKKYA